MNDGFSTSITAQRAAQRIIDVAGECGFLDGPLATDEALAIPEKELFVRMFRALPDNVSHHNGELSGDQISSLFTFVFAKGAEAAAQIYEGVEDIKLETEGMLTGRIPIAAGEILNDYAGTLDFHIRCTENFLALSEEPDFSEPLFSLFEALKWCFRLSFHIFWEYLEQQH